MQTSARWELPPRPTDLARRQVAAWRAEMAFPTYEPTAPEPYPAFLNHRVYQGSNGRVHPLPYVEGVATEATPRTFQALHIENDLVRVMVLPELGGRIHVGYDRVNDYDFFYRNGVIKPALVGLAGPWVSGGVEFNWPQHHRPATFLPMASTLVNDPDGTATLWCADHDPFTRMREWHGVRLRPDSSTIELLVRLHNTSDVPQTFLWWANVAAEVHDDYQSFFPPDVTYVADHAARATVSFPRARSSYYGIDYPGRVTPEAPDADRLDWYRNIPVPTSYMVVSSAGEFFGGYDHAAGAGFVHWADRAVSPGKKQWTWGNTAFGRAWDRNLSDDGRPYVELMAGVFTDNQPDFGFLAPGETRTFSQYWYPIAGTGAIHGANLDAAVHFDPAAGRVAAYAPKALTGAIRVTDDSGATLWSEPLALAEHTSQTWTIDAADWPDDVVCGVVVDGREVLSVLPPRSAQDAPVPPPAVAPAAPADVADIDELYQIGRHLDQYRHATRSPEPYWAEALRRDPDDARCNAALADRHYRRGDYAAAEGYAAASIRRLTRWNKNPEDCWPLYLHGLILARLGRQADAEAAWQKAAWDRRWLAPAMARLASGAARRGDASRALDLADRGLEVEPRHAFLTGLRVVALRRLGRDDEASTTLSGWLAFDPLHPWAAALDRRSAGDDPQTLLDVARLAFAAGDGVAAGALLTEAAQASRSSGQSALGMIPAWTAEAWGLDADVPEVAGPATIVTLDDLDAVRAAMIHHPDDPVPARTLGDWAFHRDQVADAARLWEASDRIEPTASAARNLGIISATRGDDVAAVACYDQARQLDPASARLLLERDGLAARLAEPLEARLARLDVDPELVASRDDLAITQATLLTLTGRPRDAVAALAGRRFQPWEGGEGVALGAWEWAQLFSSALVDPDAVRAALDPPESLGEARHPLANAAHLYWALGEALHATGEIDAARDAWTQAARQSGDFQVMASVAYSELTLFSILAARRLGDHDTARMLTAGLADFVEHHPDAPDLFFATSLPQVLPFPATYDRDHARRLELMRAGLDLIEGRDARARLAALVAEAPDLPIPQYLTQHHNQLLIALADEAISPTGRN